jgi:predicted nucleotidyltransferase
MPTALELGKSQWRMYRDRYDREPLDGSKRQKQNVDDLIRHAHLLGNRIKREFGARRVLLFGSLAGKNDFTEKSDIDLAVEGLTGSQFWQVWKLAEDYFPDHPVDVVEFELASKSMREAIEKHGVAV